MPRNNDPSGVRIWVICLGISLIESDLASYDRTQQVMRYRQFCQTVLKLKNFVSCARENLFAIV